MNDFSSLQGVHPDILAIPVEPPATPKIPRPPTEEEVRKEITALKLRDNLRNERIYTGRRVTRESDEYAASVGYNEETRGGIVKLSMPATIVRETARLIGRQVPLVIVAADGESQDAALRSEKVEAFLQWFDSRTEDMHQARGESDTLKLGRSWYAAQDGRLVEIVVANPDNPDFPFRTRLVDPADCHYIYGEDGIKRMYRIMTMTSEAIRAEWGDDLFKDTEPSDTPHEVVAMYDRHYLGVMLDGPGGGWLKKPVEHGYGCLPVIVSHFNGRPGASQETTTATEDEREANKGTGVFWPHVEEYTAWVRVVSAQLWDTVLNSDPPVVKYLAPGDRDFETEVEPGEPITLPNGAKIDLLYRKGGLEHAKATAELLSTMIQSGTLPVGQLDFPSGFDRMIASQKGQSYFIPIVEGLRGHYQRLYRTVLNIFANIGCPCPVASQANSGALVVSEFTPDMVPDNPIVSVEFGDVGSVDKWAALSAATNALGAGVLDPYTFYHSWLREPHARQIVDRITAWKGRQNPAVAQMLTQLDLAAELRDRMVEAERREDFVVAEMARLMLDQLVQQTQMGGIMQTGKQAPPELPLQGLSGGNGSQGGPSAGATFGGPAAGAPGANPQMIAQMLASMGNGQNASGQGF